VIAAMLGLMLVVIVSGLVNDMAPMTVLYALKSYVTYAGLFIAVVLIDLTEQQQRVILNLLIALILLQVVAIFGQTFALLPGAAAAGSGTEDSAGGTLGANTTGILSLMSVALAGAMLAYMVFDKIRARYFVIALMVLVAPILAEGKIVVFLLPLIVLFVFGLKLYLEPRTNWKQTAIMVLLAATFTAAIILVWPLLAPTDNLTILLSSPDALLHYLELLGNDPTLADLGRLSAMQVTLQDISAGMQSLWLGFGSGLLSRTGGDYAVPASLLIDLDRGAGGTQATAMLLETGILGAAAYAVLIATLVPSALSAARRTASRAILSQTTAFLTAWVVYAVGIFYCRLWWSVPLSVSFWIFAAIVWTNVNRAKGAGQLESATGGMDAAN